jgi:hypothetical protein
LPDVLWGVDFLRQVGEEKQIGLKDKVIVIGGGNVAIDVALTARRLGAKAVTMACLESREEMPAHAWEIEGALAEGVRIMTSWGPHRILRENGKTVGVELVRCSSVFDDKGNFCPAFEDTKERIEGEQVIMAIGQATALSFLERSREISVDRGLIVVNQETLETGMKGVYAGGDVTEVTGAIIRAMAAGRKVASSIDRALGGTGEIDEVLFERAPANQFLGRDEGYAYWPREPVPELDPGSRVSGFQEISLGYTEEQAVKEAKRCLQCDLRLCMATNPPPPEKLLAFTEDNVNGIPEAEGVYQLYDEDHKVLVIKGTATLRDSLLMELRETEGAAWFEFEEDKMYSKRESELIQQYLQEHGEMHGGGDSDLDDLF